MIADPAPFHEQATSLVRFAVVGDVEYDSAEDFDALLTEVIDLLAAPDVAAVVADLTKVGFLDSTGVNQLLRLHRHTAPLPGGLHLVIAPEQRALRSVFEVVGLLSVFAGVHDTAADAVLAASPRWSPTVD